MAIKKNRVTAMIGPSGCGKSQTSPVSLTESDGAHHSKDAAN